MTKNSPTEPADTTAEHASFKTSRDRFEQVCSFLGDQEAASLTHSELEQRLTDGARRGSVEPGHARPLQTVFGAVDVTRLAYRRRGERNMCPADAALNLPRELHSHGLRELSAIESSRGSFEDASDAIRRITGVRLGKRQLEQLAARAAADFETFYAQPARSQAAAAQGDLLVLSADGKG